MRHRTLVVLATLSLAACERPTPQGGSARDRVLDTAAAVEGDMAADSAALWLADSMLHASTPRARFRLERLEVSRAGDFGYTRSVVIATDTTPGPTRLTVLTVWRRGADGVWQIATDLSRDDVPTTAPRDSVDRD